MTDTVPDHAGYVMTENGNGGFLMRIFLIAFLMGFSLFGPAPFAFSEEEEGDKEFVGKPKLEMSPFNFSVIKRGIVEGQATLQIVLVMENTQDFEVVRSRLPQVRSDFNTALSMLSRQTFQVNRPIDPDIVKAYLTPYIDARLGVGMAEVFVKQALIHPN